MTGSAGLQSSYRARHVRALQAIIRALGKAQASRSGNCSCWSERLTSEWNPKTAVSDAPVGRHHSDDSTASTPWKPDSAMGECSRAMQPLVRKQTPSSPLCDRFLGKNQRQRNRFVSRLSKHEQPPRPVGNQLIISRGLALAAPPLSSWRSTHRIDGMSLVQPAAE